MAAETPEDRATRSAPPQAGSDTVDDRGAAAEVLRDSELRVAEASQADAPGDAADEHRRSEDTVEP